MVDKKCIRIVFLSWLQHEFIQLSLTSDNSTKQWNHDAWTIKIGPVLILKLRIMCNFGFLFDVNKKKKVLFVVRIDQNGKLQKNRIDQWESLNIICCRHLWFKNERKFFCSQKHKCNRQMHNYKRIYLCSWSMLFFFFFFSLVFLCFVSMDNCLLLWKSNGAVSQRSCQLVRD